MVGFILFVPFGIRSIAPSFMQIRAEYLPSARHCETPETQKESHSPDFEELWTGKLTQKRKRHRRKERQGDIERERRGGKGRERAAALMWEHLSDSKILTAANIGLPTAWHTAGNNPNTHHQLSLVQMLWLWHKQTSQRSEGGRLTSRLQKQAQNHSRGRQSQPSQRQQSAAEAAGFMFTMSPDRRPSEDRHCFVFLAV